MPKVEEDYARLVLKELAEAFGVDPPEPGVEHGFDNWAIEENGAMQVKKPGLLYIAMDGRLYLENGKATYRLRNPIGQLNGETIPLLSIRSPSATDYLEYSKGMVVSVSREHGADVDMVMMAKRTIKAVARLSDRPESIIGRMGKKDLDDLTKIGDALGFFD